MTPVKSKLQRQSPLSSSRPNHPRFALVLCTLLSACGGGGGGSSPPAEPPPVFEQSRISVKELGTACIETSRDCLHIGGLFIDEDSEVTIFWHERPPSDQPGWHVATHPSGGTDMRNATHVSVDMDSQLLPLSLGAKRFAAMQRDTPNWTSALVDLSMPVAPHVSPRVTTPLTGFRPALFSDLDGVLTIGTDVPNGSFSLGGTATARAIQVATTPGYVNLWWDEYAPATGVTATLWRAFNAAQTNATEEQRLHLARIDASDGQVLDVRPVTNDVWRQSSIPDCSTFGGAHVLIREYGVGRVAIGWRNVNSAWTGCDVVVDGEVLNDVAAQVIAGPVMAGTPSGLVAIWSERDLADNPTSQQHLVWRHKDASASQWSAPVRLDSQTITTLRSSATGPGGTLAIAWQGCRFNNVESCTEYASKFVDGQWTTEQYLTRGQGASSPQVAINAKGQAVVAWSNVFDAKCSANPARSCPRVFAFRF